MNDENLAFLAEKIDEVILIFYKKTIKDKSLNINFNAFK